MNVRILIAVILIPALGLVAAGCQPGGPPPPEAYERLANAICTNNTGTLNGIAAEIGDPETPADRQGSLRLAMIQLHKNELETLKQLTPPDAVRARAEQMYKSYGDIIRMLEGKSANKGESLSLLEATMLLNESMRALALTDCARTATESYPGMEVGTT